MEKEQKIKKPIFKRWWIWVLIAGILIGLFMPKGDTEQTVTPTEEPQVEESAETSADQANEAEKKDSVEIDFEKLNSDLHEDLQIGANSEDYPFVQDYYVGVSDDKKTIFLTAVVDDSTDPEKALDFADTLVRRANLNAQLQDGSIESPSKDTYGGLYDRYQAIVGVGRASERNDSNAWFVNAGITSSDGPKLKLQNE